MIYDHVNKSEPVYEPPETVTVWFCPQCKSYSLYNDYAHYLTHRPSSTYHGKPVAYTYRLDKP